MNVNTYLAWLAASADQPAHTPAPFAWPGEVCLGGPAEGDHGVPLGLLTRSRGASWSVLAASRRKVWLFLSLLLL